MAFVRSRCITGVPRRMPSWVRTRESAIMRRHAARSAAAPIRRCEAPHAVYAERPLSERQIHAISAMMHLFVEEDGASGVATESQLTCAVCDAERPAPGFIQYNTRQVCNRCATDYEIHRARGIVANMDDYRKGLRLRRTL